MRKKKPGLLWATGGLTLVCGIILIIKHSIDGDWMGWQAVAVFAAITVVASFITARQKIRSDAHPNLHYADICDNCVPLKMADGKSPITDLVMWGAAHYKMTREEVATVLNDDRWFRLKAEVEHEAYLKLFKPRQSER